MAKDATYTNGVIAVKEKYLLNDKIFKMCETGADEALRTLSEAGFGKGVEISSVYEYERLVAADEAAIDEFIREYAPSQAEAEYLLAGRDFHNAKAIVKARFMQVDPAKMLAPDGLIPVQVISDCIAEGKYGKLGSQLSDAVKQAAELLSENGEASGAEIGNIFEKALFRRLKETCKKNPLLKKFLAVKADMTNILTAMRSSTAEYARHYYVDGGKLSETQLAKLFSDDKEKASNSLNGTPYSDFVKKCFENKAENLPLTEAEKTLESLEIDYFSKRKYELRRSQPFLYYVFRRRAENSNVRILFVCLLAGMRDSDIKKRLR